MKRALLIATAFLMLTAFAVPSEASTIIHFTKPLADGTVTVTVTSNGVTDVTTVKVSKTDSAKEKRDKVYDALKAKGYNVTKSGGAGSGPAIIIKDLADGTTVDVNTGKTGEANDEQTTDKAAAGSISFDGAFVNVGLDGGGAASFTAGIVTALGRAAITYRAEDFAPGELIDGSYVAQRLFLDLADAASDLGAQLNLGESSVEVSFDPAAGAGAGVVFGTTSPSEGCTGSLTSAGGDRETPRQTQP